MDLYQRAQAEVEDLHRCVFAWCGGDVADTAAAWERIEASWATGFRLIDVDGKPVEGSAWLNRLQARFREPVHERLRALWIEGFTGTRVADDLFLAIYEEWERDATGGEAGRACSALLRSGGEGPYQLQWVHAHRAPLPHLAKPSFRPPDAVAQPALDAQAEAPTAPPVSAGDDVPYILRQHPADAPLPEVASPGASHVEGSPEQAIRAFFGDVAAQEALGQGPPPDYELVDVDCWLRVLREAGTEAVVRAGCAALEFLLERWEAWFPHEVVPRQIAGALARWLDGDADALGEAQGLIEAAEAAAQRVYGEAESYLPSSTPQQDFEDFLERSNAAVAAARLAAAAGGRPIAAAVKLSPVLAGLSEPRRRALRPRILAAFAPA